MKAVPRRWWIWLPLLAVAAWLAVFGDKSPAGAQLSLPIATPRSPSVAAAPTAPPEPAVVALIAREALYPVSPPVASDAKPRDPFSSRSWAPPPQVQAPVAPPPPSAPPVPYAVIGKKFEAGQWEVFLARGEQTFLARPGQTLEGTYRVDRIQPPALTLTYLPLGQEQTLAIGDER
jgi:hypothetical protein